MYNITNPNILMLSNSQLEVSRPVYLYITAWESFRARRGKNLKHQHKRIYYQSDNRADEELYRIHRKSQASND